MSRFSAWMLVFTAIASPLHAQRLSEITAGFRPSSGETGSFQAPYHWTAATSSQRSAVAPAWSVALSAILPGSGQAALGSNRAIPYLAVEAFAWTSYVRHALQYRRRRDGYRDLAARVARAAFSSLAPNGDFEYYEHMTHYPEAGRYDLVAGGGIDPETDTTTYNGAVWLLARRTFWVDPFTPPDTASPEWTRAVAFYQSRAYDQQYRWSWTGAPQEYARFMTLIDESNDANRLAMLDLGVIIANHVLSTVDAYITVRLRRDVQRREFVIEGSLPFPHFIARR